MLTELANFDQEIRLTSTAKETTVTDLILPTIISFFSSRNTATMSNSNSMKIVIEHNVSEFQLHSEKLNCFVLVERFSHKTLSADTACMAFNARTKLHIDPERRMIGLT